MWEDQLDEVKPVSAVCLDGSVSSLLVSLDFSLVYGHWPWSLASAGGASKLESADCDSVSVSSPERIRSLALGRTDTHPTVQDR